MKKAALLLMMSSTAFAAPQLVATQAQQAVNSPQAVKAPHAAKTQRAAQAPQHIGRLQHPPQLSRHLKHGQAPQALPMSYAPQAASPQLAKRSAPAKQALQTTTAPSGIQAPKIGDFELKFQLRNTMTVARAEELQDIGGKEFGNLAEIRAGLKHKSGWGFMLTGANATTNFADNGKNTGNNGDATMILNVPSLIKTDSFHWFGYARAYFPTSDRSASNNVSSQAWYNFFEFNLGHNVTATNLTIARVFSRDLKQDSDLTSFVYNSLEFAHQTTSWAALSFGGQFEADNTVRNGTGHEIDLYPFVDIAVTPNILIEPKYYFPVFVGGNGGVGASGASMNQSYFELFVKLAI